jgi:hypothetical protein
MKHGRYGIGKESGIALVALLVLLIMAGAYAFYRYANVAGGRIQQEATLAATLARAKEALIARAVTDANRPGSLPCPDTVGDGKAAMFTLTQCPSYVGWLPWVSLDLPELTDDTGTRLWYALSPTLRDDDSAQPINSDTPMSLRIDGGVGEIAAIIIAPRSALTGQTRPSNNAADYLEGDNANGDANYVSGPASNSFNDMVAIITRQELMAAVEKRIANEIKACLEEHAASTVENPAQTYPWPAPLANSIFKGTAESLFGMVPATQPGGNPDVDLKQSISDLTSAQNTLTTAWAGNDLATAQQALTAINEISAYARAQFDRLFIVAEALYQTAKAAADIFSQLGSAPDGSAIAAAMPSLAAFQGALSNSGIDVFLAELSDQNEILAQKINAAASMPSYDSFNDLQTQDNLFRRKIYGYSITPNPDITQTIAVAAPIATDARDKAATAKNLSDYTTEPNITLANQAISRANDLFNANTAIYNTTLATRVNIDASEMRYLARRLEALLAAYSTTPDTYTLNTLVTALNGAIQSVTAVSTGSTTVLAERSVTLGALNATLPANANTIVTLTGVAISRTDALATAIESNGDNVLLETLKIADSRLAQAGTLDAATLKNTVDSVDYWATQTATYANDIARKARKRVNIPTVNDSSTSAYTIAGQLLASLDGSTGSIAALNDYTQAPGDSAKATAAQTAVNATQTALSNTIGSASTLESILESGTAQAATETRWYGNACAFLRPATATPSWWSANQWRNTTFYQISDRVRPASGKLKVNGSGTYRVVALSAGRAIATQNRATRTTANFLEGINTDVSRNGDAKTPVVVFSNAPVSGTFNDRLGY